MIAQVRVKVVDLEVFGAQRARRERLHAVAREVRHELLGAFERVRAAAALAGL